LNEVKERIIFLLAAFSFFLMETGSSTMIFVNPSQPSKVWVQKILFWLLVSLLWIIFKGRKNQRKEKR